MRGSHIVQCPHHVLRVSKIQQHLNAMGIFVIVFAKRILPYLRHRSTALQNPQNKHKNRHWINVNMFQCSGFGRTSIVVSFFLNAHEMVTDHLLAA